MSSIIEGLTLHREAVEHCEAVYMVTEGEITEEVEQAEAARDLSARQAAESLASYIRWIDGRDAMATAEEERLAAFRKGNGKRRAWAEARLLALKIEASPDKALMVGTYTIRTRRSRAVACSGTINPNRLSDAAVISLPPEWVRTKTETIRSLDKQRVKDSMSYGWKEGPIRSTGWYDFESGRRRWVEVRGEGGLAMTRTRFESETIGGHQSPVPDGDRWKHFVDGITLEDRITVKVC